MNNFERGGNVVPINRERPKNNLERLNSLVKDISLRINADVEKQYGIKNLVTADGAISMEGFSKSNGGIYDTAEVISDQNDDAMSEVSNSMAYSHPEGSAERKAVVDEWRERKNRSKATQIEMAIMALFYKILKEEFIVVRSATHDDYTAGVDNLIVNKKTGEVLCAIDDVHEEDRYNTKSENLRGKPEKTKKIAEKGGVKVKYGLTMQAGKLKKTKLENVPVFYLGLTSEQLDSLIANMGDSPDLPPSDAEQKIFLHLVSSLQEQKNELNKLNLKPGIKKNIAGLESSLQRLKQIGELPKTSMARAA